MNSRLGGSEVMNLLIGGETDESANIGVVAPETTPLSPTL